MMTKLQVTCRSCGSADLELVLSCGQMPLANALLSAGRLAEPEPRFPLDLVFCPSCSLVQITETVPPEVLFRDYLYFSSFSDTVLANSEAIARRLMAERSLDGNSLVVEIASNDGYLLKNYCRAGIPVLGIEPARNVARVAEQQGIRTLAEFFGLDLAERLTDDGVHADVIHANNVLAHVADLNGLVAGIATLLKPQGLAVIETPYVKDLIDRCEFDTVYHEHLCYYSLTALVQLFERHGLIIQDVERLPIHGGSLRVFATRATAAIEGSDVRALLAQEKAWGVDRLDFYRCFARQVADLKSALCELLSDLKSEGKRIAAYGAAAKGSTLLNYFGIGSDLLDFVVDRSTYKQGHYMPGVHLPICPPERLLEDMPDYTLLLTWNFASEIVRQQAAYIQRGGQFIVPIPRLEIVNAGSLAQAHGELIEVA